MTDWLFQINRYNFHALTEVGTKNIAEIGASCLARV